MFVPVLVNGQAGRQPACWATGLMETSGDHCMGQIGQAIARRARGFGMSIHYHNRKAVHPSIEAELEATYWEDLDEMLRRMDIVSVNCLNKQQKGCCLLNVCR